ETGGKIEGGVNTLSPESGPARVFVGSHDYFLYALNAETGEVLWKHETGNYVVSTPSMIRADGVPALAFGGCDGLLHVIPADGEGEKREIEIGAYIANTSAVRDGISYIAHNGGEVVAVEIASGEALWKTQTGIEYTASPAVDESLLYVAGPDKRLVAYDRTDGAEKWAFLATRALASSPLVSEDVVWQGGMDGRLYAVDRATGEEMWNFELGTQIKASPAASRGTLVVCGEDGVVYGFTR
ncbi:MAG: PQQ-like beta-propeller repeat protein, partial [Verrucomicrobiaceae bacterium]|nr:PQQ-like beta-propeller repeat protein [Verrucomicrobiaceae bacterium]